MLSRPYISTAVLALATLGLSLYSIFVGVIDLRCERLLALDLAQLEILLASRLPRLAAILLSGMALSVAGLIMQCLCMNKFVSPTTGATISSAQFGILLALLFLPNSSLAGRALFAFVFALLGTFIFVSFILRARFRDVVMVPLVGIMFGSIISGITSFLAFRYDMTQALSSWLVGHFSTVLRGNYEIVYLTLPLVVVAFIFTQYFNLVGLGRDFAVNLGVSYNAVLFMGLALAAALTASVVVVVGAISYIGLIIPNLVAIYKGDNLRHTLIDTALSGALFVLLCDIVAREVIHPYELPIDLIVGMVGSLIFIALIFMKLTNARRLPCPGQTLCRGRKQAA